MLNKEMIDIFLTDTKLSQPGNIGKMYDVILPIDIMVGSDTDINNLVQRLTKEQAKDFYDVLCLAWLFDVPPVTNYSWGWLRYSSEDEWTVTPISYSFKEVRQKPYTVRGTTYNPGNMILFLNSKDSYIASIRRVYDECYQFVDKYQVYEHPEVPLYEQLQFIGELRAKLKEMEEALRLAA